MSLHPDTPLTPEIEAEIRRLVSALSEDDLVTLARTEPDFQSGGFRAANTAATRTRATQLAAGPQPISDAFRRLLSRHSLNRTLVALLSSAALADLRNELAALFGAARVQAALLLDERPEVREAGARWVRQPAPASAVASEEALGRLRDTFAVLLEATGGVDASVPATREAWKDAREQLEQQLREARAELRRLKGVEERQARLREQVTAHERDAAGMRARLAEAESGLRATARERDAIRAELDRERNHRDERLLAALDARIAIEAAGWLAPARAVEAEASTPSGAADALLQRADEAIARQAATDRHSGNRAAVDARLSALNDRLARVRDALTNALQPLPELADAERALASETARLGSLLNRPSGPSPLESALAARFAAATANELPGLRELVMRLLALGALDGGSSARLVDGIHRRQAIMAATAGESADAQRFARAETAEGDASPLERLRCSLSGRGPAILLIDGHNVLFGLQGRYQPPQGGLSIHAGTRDRLVFDVVRLVGGHPTCRAWIVFDGPTRSESTPAPNVRVLYSGGEGEHRADGLLIDTIRFFRASDEIPIVLVSNDNALGQEARRLGAGTLSALAFGGLL
jgi:hypothetical protein